LTEPHALTRWQIHVNAAVAVTSHQRAIVAHEGARQRSTELVALWTHARIRRKELASQREQLRARRAQHPTSLTFETGSSTGLLETARRLANLSVSALWIDYVALGGGKSIPELSAMLRDEVRVEAHEHDLMAVALNERFCDQGMGRPIDYSSPSDSPRS
jgi:hypothetical protein